MQEMKTLEWNGRRTRIAREREYRVLRGRLAGGAGGGGTLPSLAAVVFRGMLGGRFPRGLCYRLGRMTSPRYQILNLLLAPAAYPRQDIQTVLPPLRRAATGNRPP